MVRGNNVVVLNILKNKIWLSSWYVHRKEYSFLLQEELLLFTYLRSALSDVQINGFVGLRIYKFNNILVFDVYLFFIVFFVKKTLVLFIRHINTFFKNNAILVINRLSFVDISVNSFFIAFKVAKLIEKRMRFRSKIIKSLLKEVSKYCVGVYVQCAGRISDSNIARKDRLYVGSTSLNTVNFFVSYSLVIANTIKGLQSIKVWIHVY